MKTHKITDRTESNKPYSYYVDVAGPAPEGYRWLAEHETVQKGDIQALWSGQFDENPSFAYGRTGKGYLPCARPITPEPKKAPMPTHTPKTLKYKIVTRQNGLVAVQITEQSHRYSEFGKDDSNWFGALRSGDYPESKGVVFYVHGIDGRRDDDPLLLTDSQFKEFEKEVAAYNSHFSKPAILKVVFFEYSAGSVRGYRRVEVVKEDSTYLEGIDSKKGEYRKFLKSKIIGPVDTVKA